MDENRMISHEVFAQPNIVGREAEFEKLHRILQYAIADRGNTVFVSGEAGAGKTRLISEFLTIAKKEGVISLTGRCLSNAAVPYFPFFEAFNAFFSANPIISNSDSIQQDVIGWLSGPARCGQTGSQQPLTAQTWKDQTFEAVTKTLTAISYKAPVILFIDDIQWADSASLSLLHWIARSAKSKKIVVLASYRSEEVNYDGEGHPSQLLDTIRLMGREELFIEIKLPSLSEQDILKMAENMLGACVSKEFAQALTKESQGNPLFIVESLRMLSENGSILCENRQCRLSIDAVGVPSKIKDIILRRFGWLKLDQRKMLDAASVIGERFSVELLASVLGQESFGVLENLNAIAQTTSLVCAEDDSYRFDHAKSKETIYNQIPSPLRRAIHSKVADKLENTKLQDKMPLTDIAYHYAQAGIKDKAVKYASAAGKDALSRWSNQEAINHYRYVLTNIPENSDGDETRRSAKEGLGDALYANCKFEEAYQVYVDLANTESGQLKSRAYRKAIDAIFRKGEPKRLIELIDKSQQFVSSDRIENARVLWSKARAETYSGDLQGSLRDHEEALRIFEEEYSLPDMAQLLCGTASANSFVGNHDRSLYLCLRSISLFQELKDADGELNASYIASITFAFAGLREETIKELLDVLRLSENLGQYNFMTHAHFALANNLEAQERFEEALSHGLKGVESSNKTDNKNYLINGYSCLVRLYSILGNIAQAQEYLEKLKSDFDLFPMLPFHLAFATAMISAAKSQWQEAESQFKKALELSQLAGNSLTWEIRIRKNYGLALNKQGRVEEGELQFQIVRNIFVMIEKKYDQAIVQGSLVSRRLVYPDKEFELRLDIVNVGRRPVLSIEVCNLSLDNFKIISLPPGCNLENGVLTIRINELNAFKVKTVKLAIKSLKTGTFALNPTGMYGDSMGINKKFGIQPIVITVSQPESRSENFKGSDSTTIVQPVELAGPTPHAKTLKEESKPFVVFICYKRSSGKDFADHLKSGLEELGLHTFLDSKDIPLVVEDEEGWAKARDKALEESKFFVLVMTPGINLSSEVVKEIEMARKQGNKTFVFFRHRNMGRKIVVKLNNEVLDISKLEQISFETKEELLRLAHSVLAK